jgi:hypothetical protein
VTRHSNFQVPVLIARWFRLCVLRGILLWGALSAGCDATIIPSEARELAAGVIHHEISLIEGPWAIHVIEIDLPRAWSSGVRLQVARPHPSTSGLEKTSVLARDAIAAINGDLWYRDTPGQTLGLQITGGSLIDEPRRQSAFAITDGGKPLIAVFIAEAGLITSSGETLSLSMFNRAPTRNSLTYYNRFANASHDSIKAEVGFHLVSLGKQSVINDTVVARVRQVRRHAWPLRLAAGEWFVAAGADYAQANGISAGDTLRLFCLLHPATENLQEASGGGPRILRDGRISIEYKQEHLGQTPALERHPRTAVGYSKDGETLFLVTVDGRQPGYSVGMSLKELAGFMANSLTSFSQSRKNAYQALNLDGGGSTTMVVKQHVVNRPSDPTGQSPVANALLVTTNQDT